MADEPSNGELGRRLDNITVILQNLVGTREFGEFQRYVTHLLGELAQDIASERTAREEAIKAERAAREKAITEVREASDNGFKEIRAEKATGWQNSRLAFLTTVGTVVAALVIAALSGWIKAGGH